MAIENRFADTMLEGRHEPMGSFARDGGVNFAVFSQHATRMEVCVFSAEGRDEIRRFPLFGPHDGVFHGFLPGAGSGLIYGLRAHGPYEPSSGHRFNPHKLLLDPCAREIVGKFEWRAEHHGYTIGHPEGARSFDMRDNASGALKARVAAQGGIAVGFANAPRHPGADVVLYEVHVKGFSKLRDDIPEAQRGTYTALAHPASIAHFKSLGITTLSLLPIQYCVDESALVERGMSNYWGYNTLGFFCPDPRLSMYPHDPAAVNTEFRQMVETLHSNALEVVLDVVYNHTPEGSELGPTLSFRGLDNASWYRLVEGDKSRNENLTGCGNTLNAAHPRVTQFILDSLRYWVQEMGVDGFRFDLAPVLGRGDQGFDECASFFTAMRQDPILERVHLIAEPWDAGPDGYQLGRFPGRFLEWNDKFRDTVRGYWLGTGVSRGELARRFTASSDLFRHDQRSPTASVNFISVHDGFTLTDMVSYSHKHNHANGEDNRDGRDNELCGNFGVEGETADLAVLNARGRVMRAMMATLLLAQGTPMLCAGDEIGNSQQGNNNAYCQDNEIGWLNWQSADLDFKAFVAGLIALRREEPMLRYDHWFDGPSENRAPVALQWCSPNGCEMQTHEWNDRDHRGLGLLLGHWQDNESHAGARLMILFNAELRAMDFSIPHGNWQTLVDSSAGIISRDAPSTRDVFPVCAQSLVVLRDISHPDSSQGKPA